MKHAFQVFLLLAICTWMLYQVMHADHKNAAEEEYRAKESEIERIKFGRKELRPPSGTDYPEDEGRAEKDEESAEDLEEMSLEEMEVEGRGVGDDEIDGNDQERAEEADDADELEEDFIDKENKETDESSVTEKDQSEVEAREDQANRFLQDQRKGHDGSDVAHIHKS